MIDHEQKWEDRKTVQTAKDEITVGTEQWRSEEWSNKGRVAGAKLMPDLAWLHPVSTGKWKKVVVDVKVTSTDKMNEAFREKDEKYREWATKETRETKVVKAVMVPLIISHDGAVRMDTVRQWNDFAPDIKVTGCGWHRVCCATMMSLSESSLIRAAGSPRLGERSTHKKRLMKLKVPLRESQQPRKKEELHIDTDLVGVVCAALGNATTIQRSDDVRWKGKPKLSEYADQSTNLIEFVI